MSTTAEWNIAVWTPIKAGLRLSQDEISACNWINRKPRQSGDDRRFPLQSSFSPPRERQSLLLSPRWFEGKNISAIAREGKFFCSLNTFCVFSVGLVTYRELKHIFHEAADDDSSLYFRLFMLCVCLTKGVKVIEGDFLRKLCSLWVRSRPFFRGTSINDKTRRKLEQ